MLGAIVWLGIIFWVLFDAVKRKDEKAALWTIGTALLFPVVLPFYLATRPLLPGETRPGGTPANVLKYAAVFWTVLVGLVQLMSDTLRTDLFFFWLVPFAITLGLSYAFRKPSVIQRGAPLPAGQVQGAAQDGFDRRLLWITPVIVVVVVVLGVKGYLDTGTNTGATDEVSQQIAVDAVKSRVEPTLGLVALNPDTATGNWFAVKGAVGYSCAGECITVYYRVDVMPSTEKKRMNFQWVYDTKTGDVQPANTEARTLFVTR